ncbi:Sodium/solute symporter, partial [hydrothermal vent metagenome]
MNWLDYVIIIAYLGGFLGLGYFFKDNKSSKDYFLGGREVGWFPLSLSVMATQLSAISFISAPAFVGLRPGGGMSWLTFEFAVPLAMILVVVVIVPPLYKSGVVSIYEYLEKRFDASSRLLISFVFQISRSFGTGVMVYAVALILQSVLNIQFWQTIIIIGAITLIYSFQGGMRAVVYGDMIQMIILFVGILVSLGFGLYAIGGWHQFLTHMDMSRLTAVNFSKMGFHDDGFGFWPMLIGGLFLYTSYYGTDQTQMQRMLSAKDTGTIRKLLTVNGLFRFPITFIYSLMGLVLGTLYFMDPSFQAALHQVFIAHSSLKSSTDLLVPVFIVKYLPNGIIGILLVAIMSAAMSSLSSTINSLSAVT